MVRFSGWASFMASKPRTSLRSQSCKMSQICVKLVGFIGEIFMGTNSFAKSRFLWEPCTILMTKLDLIDWHCVENFAALCASLLLSSSSLRYFSPPLVSSVQSLKMGFVDNRIHHYQYSSISIYVIYMSVWGQFEGLSQVYQEPYPIASLNGNLVELNEWMNHVLNLTYQKIW